MPVFLAPSNTLTVPCTFSSISFTGSSIEILTIVCAAKWTTASNFSFSIKSHNSGLRISKLTKDTFSGKFSREPVLKLSTTINCTFSDCNFRTKWEPINPAPPVINIFILVSSQIKEYL